MARYIITNEPAPIDFECGDDQVLRTLQNAKNLLTLRRGEVPFDRDRGFDDALFHLPLADMEEQLLPELDRVMLWEPDVDVASAYLTVNSAGETVIHCIIQTEVA